MLCLEIARLSLSRQTATTEVQGSMQTIGPQKWTNNTAWRQGHLLDSQDGAALGLAHPTDGDNTCIVVIAHDCDLATDDLDIEPNAEVIVGRFVPKLEGNFAWAKSARTLHLTATASGTEVVIELVATHRALLAKEELAQYLPSKTTTIAPKEIHVLRKWLAARYNRPSFADAFVERMKAQKLDAGLAKKVGQYGAVISNVYFDIDEGKEIDRSDGSPYELAIVLVYAPGAEPDEAAETAEKAEAAIVSMFEDKCFNNAAGTWKSFNLKTCISVSEDDLTITQAKSFVPWRLEYMSLKEQGAEPASL